MAEKKAKVADPEPEPPEPKPEDDVPQGKTIDDRMADLLKDHERMGAR